MGKWTEQDIEALFVLAGAGTDFCIDRQDDKTVCGGWNRVYLFPDGTIKASDRHCTSVFKKVCTEIGIEFV